MHTHRFVAVFSLLLSAMLAQASYASLSPDNGINATYWCAWGANTSYSVAGKQIQSNPVDMNLVDSCYNVIITAFIITDDGGNYVLSLANPGAQGSATYTESQVKDMVAKTKGQGRKVIVSLGGQYFHLSMQTQEDVAAFVTQTKSIVDNYGFEGIDLDLETDTLSAIDPVLMGQAVMAVVNYYRGQGQDFWLTLAPEWCYIVPFMYGSGQWASHSLAGSFYVDLIQAVGLGNFSYIWPQLYNQGPANGFAGPDKDGQGYATKVIPTDGMDKFLSGFAWAAATADGYAANGSLGVLIPNQKLALGIPATEGAAGGEMTYIATPGLIAGAWRLMQANSNTVAGFMNWSVDWDALAITDGELSPGYAHTPWATGLAVAQAVTAAGAQALPARNLLLLP
ncbi:MAG: glycosyl hydrolase family 18 protein [Solidesulfovibrio sp. DCME]|uniref:glycosyl hydrolase family 18 protein n=1 Tax=Solidesulfovibrio sp. DCME TaxID=3447380 RepID=UPI003D0C621F